MILLWVYHYDFEYKNFIPHKFKLLQLMAKVNRVSSKKQLRLSLTDWLRDFMYNTLQGYSAKKLVKYGSSRIKFLFCFILLHQCQMITYKTERAWISIRFPQHKSHRVVKYKILINSADSATSFMFRKDVFHKTQHQRKVRVDKLLMISTDNALFQMYSANIDYSAQ